MAILVMQSLVKVFTCILLVEKATSLSTGMSRMKSTDGLSLEELVGLGAQTPPIPLSAEAESDVAQLLGSLEVNHAKSNVGQAGVDNTSGLGTNASNTLARTTNTSGDARQLEHIFLFKQPSGSIDPTRPYDGPMLSNSDKSMTLNSQKITSFAYNEISSGPSMTRVFAVTLVMLVVALVFVALCIFVMEEHSDHDEGPMQTIARPPEDLHIMMSCHGTWAETYQKSENERKEGLELLFRCHIIPPEEFAHSSVSQEHIDECVWIATHMLRHRKLEEWTEMVDEAARTFEESVTACFAARTGVRTELAVGTEDEPVQGAPRKAGSSVGSPRALHYLGSAADVSTRPQSDTMSPSGNFSIGSVPASGARSLNTSPSKGKYTAPSSRKEANDVLPPVLSTPADRASLMTRCRQIMAASDAQRKPRSAGAAPIDTSQGSTSAAGRNLGYGKSSSPSTNV